MRRPSTSMAVGGGGNDGETVYFHGGGNDGEILLPRRQE